jgi:hypothetical protein
MFRRFLTCSAFVLSTVTYVAAEPAPTVTPTATCIAAPTATPHVATAVTASHVTDATHPYIEIPSPEPSVKIPPPKFAGPINIGRGAPDAFGTGAPVDQSITIKKLTRNCHPGVVK